jgi:hypothetical protein
VGGWGFDVLTNCRGQPMHSALLFISACKQNSQVDIYFIVDASENIQKANFPKALAFVNSVIDSLPIGPGHVRVGLMVYNFVAKMEIPLNKFHTTSKLKAAVNKIKFTGGGCSIFDALKAARTVLVYVNLIGLRVTNRKL